MKFICHIVAGGCGLALWSDLVVQPLYANLKANCLAFMAKTQIGINGAIYGQQWLSCLDCFMDQISCEIKLINHKKFWLKLYF